MSVAEAKALALRPRRFEHLLFCSGDNNDQLGISMTPIVPESLHRLKKPKGSSVRNWHTLPGNRWLWAMLSLENNDYQVSLWDLQSPIKAEGTNPVCSIEITQPHQPTHFFPMIRQQLDKDHYVVNLLLSYMTNANDRVFEIFQLSWNEGRPSFALKAAYRDSNDGNRFRTAWIDRDYVCIHRYNGLLLWNWRLDTRGLVWIDDWVSSPRPLLFQPPYIIPRQSPIPRLFVLDLNAMSDSSAAPTLPMAPAEINILGDLDADEDIQPKAFGQRWTFSSSDTFGTQRPDVLLSETFDEYTNDSGVLISTWMSLTRTLHCWPPVSCGFGNYEEHLILPSGALLFDPSSSPAPDTPFSTESVQLTKGTAFHYRTYPMGANMTDLRAVKLVVPHPETIDITHSPYATPHLCPISATIAVRVREEADPEDVLKIGVSRVVGLA